MSITADAWGVVPEDAAEIAEIAYADPREGMAARLPATVQPFLTWLTARPAPGEAYRTRTPLYHLATAVACLVVGVALSIAMLIGPAYLLIGLPIALSVTAAGLSKLQVSIYHHCAHGTVLAAREANRRLGTVASVLLLMKHFDVYQKEHMRHHSPNRLLTREDEFAQFLFGLCGLRPGLPKRESWRRVILALVSPRFHGRFLVRRVQSCLLTADRAQNWIGGALWTGVIAAAAFAGVLPEFAVVWLVPFVLLFQIGTALRTLCEHRFADRALIEAGGRSFVANATAGVFPGAAIPARRADSLAGVLAWAKWWAEMLSVHLFVRVLVLVGDAPCHDYHHRRPASKRWTNYIHERQRDCDRGCPGFPINYIDCWGLFRAIDQTLETLSTFEAPKD